MSSRKAKNEHFDNLILDSEDLLEPTAGQGDAKLATLHARLRKKAHQLHDKIDAVGDVVKNKAGNAARSTDRLIRRRPWQSLAVAAGVGLVLGMFAKRR
ncbi:MAG: DUF883 domain-containing protein [Gammaproteobacteria bacterium]|nr:DUF883 domain-containing protein [Gammaproteobacteria bacterium]